MCIRVHLASVCKSSLGITFGLGRRIRHLNECGQPLTNVVTAFNSTLLSQLPERYQRDFNHLAAERRTLRRLEFHRDVEPVEDPATSQLAALEGL